MSKIAVVTGGVSGIGFAIATKLKEAGCTVIAPYVGDEQQGKDFEAKLGGKAMIVDVSDFDACQKAMAEVQEEYGRVDILVNNAGITKDGMMHKMDPGQWNAVINVNLNSCFNMSRAVIEGMRERKYGRIVCISSINGVKGQMGQTNYSAAKAGMIGFVKALAQESAFKGITVNAVAPGYVATEMTKSMPEDVLDSIVKGVPMGRLAEPEEIAAVVNFLCSDEAAFITGATINANGGQYMQ